MKFYKFEKNNYVAILWVNEHDTILKYWNNITGFTTCSYSNMIPYLNVNYEHIKEITLNDVETEMFLVKL